MRAGPPTRGEASMDALAQKAIQAAPGGYRRPRCSLGKHSSKACRWAVYGYVGAVENICRRMKQELGRTPRSSPPVAGHDDRFAQTGEIFAVDKTLTLTGLQMIYAAHCKEKSE